MKRVIKTEAKLMSCCYKSQTAFMELDFEADKPRMKVVLKVMMAEL